MPGLLSCCLVVLAVHSSLDEYLANWFGLDQSKYQWALNNYYENKEAVKIYYFGMENVTSLLASGLLFNILYIYCCKWMVLWCHGACKDQ